MDSRKRGRSFTHSERAARLSVVAVGDLSISVNTPSGINQPLRLTDRLSARATKDDRFEIWKSTDPIDRLFYRNGTGRQH